MPLGVGIIVAPFRRDRHDRCLHRCPCSGWLASVGTAHPSPRQADGPFLCDHTAKSGQIHPGDQKSRPPGRARNAPCNLTGTADHPNPHLGSEAFRGSVSRRARATSAFLGRLAGGVSVTRRAPCRAPLSVSRLIDFRSAKTLHFQPLRKSKLIMEIPPKLKEYLDNNRRSLPPITDPDDPLHIDSLGVIRLIAFLENEFGICVEDEELIAENFATMRKLGELLATKTPTGPTA